jgi:aminoglycoside phosphotransferase (APT) family kinase protein
VPEWSAEFTVDEALARELVGGFFTPRSLRPLAEGWDNAVWLADERWVFRFPRREVAIPGVRRELAVLGELAPQLPLPIPVPRFVGHEPWPFFGAQLIPGRELAGADVDRDALGRALGEFLRALHSARVSVPLPEDPFGRGDMARRLPRTFEALAKIGWAPPHDVLDAARDLPPAAATCVAHGDLHIRHVLIERGAVSGVIDWGDVCRGDPSIDLPLYWCALSPAGREAFLAAYGSVSDEQLLRARVIAIFLCAVLADYGAAEGNDALARAALDGLALAT